MIVDADACPVKDEIYSVAARYEVGVTLVANSRLRVPPRTRAEMVVVAGAPDAADDWIAEHVARGDVVVTADIPLASRCIEPGRGGQTGKTNGVEWLHVTLPGDLDYKGMEYCVAVAGTANTKVVSLLSSFDITMGDVRGAAVALANKTLVEVASSKKN